MDSQQITTNPIESLKTLKSTFMAFCGFCLAGFILIMLSVFITNLPISIAKTGGIAALLFMGGYAVAAAPCILAFIFRFGVFCNVGPVFHTTYSRYDNFIIQKTERDYMTQAGASVGMTLIKLLVIFLVSLILTPIVTIALYIAYKKAYKQAVSYAEENGVDRHEIPTVSKAFYTLPALIVAVLFVGSIIGSVISNKVNAIEDAKRDTAHEKAFEAVLSNLPEEYYANTYNTIYESGGFAAEFNVDNKKIYCGKIVSNFTDGIDGIESNMIYYIIDGKAYVDLYEMGDFEILDNDTAVEYLLGRHLTNCIGSGAEFIDGGGSKSPYSLTYSYKGKEHVLQAREDGTVEIYNIILPNVLHPEETENISETKQFIDFEADLSEYKAQAKELIS